MISRQKFAVKKVIAQTEEQVKSAQKELKIMDDFSDDQHFVGYYGHSTKKANNGATEFYILMEFCAKGNLFSIMQELGKNSMRFEEKKICAIFYSVCMVCKL